MGKWYGHVGFAIPENDGTGIWTDSIREKHYYGDVTRLNRKGTGNEVNEGIRLNMQVSIVADPFAQENFQAIRYVSYLGTQWKVSNVEVAYPRLILELGEVYHA